MSSSLLSISSCDSDSSDSSSEELLSLPAASLDGDDDDDDEHVDKNDDKQPSGGKTTISSSMIRIVDTDDANNLNLSDVDSSSSSTSDGIQATKLDQTQESSTCSGKLQTTRTTRQELDGSSCPQQQEKQQTKSHVVERSHDGSVADPSMYNHQKKAIIATNSAMQSTQAQQSCSTPKSDDDDNGMSIEVRFGESISRYLKQQQQSDESSSSSTKNKDAAAIVTIQHEKGHAPGISTTNHPNSTLVLTASGGDGVKNAASSSIPAKVVYPPVAKSTKQKQNDTVLHHQRERVYTGHATFPPTPPTTTTKNSKSCSKTDDTMMDCVMIYDNIQKCYILDIVDVSVSNLKGESNHKGNLQQQQQQQRATPSIDPHARLRMAERHVRRLKRKRTTTTPNNNPVAAAKHV